MHSRSLRAPQSTTNFFEEFEVRDLVIDDSLDRFCESAGAAISHFSSEKFKLRVERNFETWKEYLLLKKRRFGRKEHAWREERGILPGSSRAWLYMADRVLTVEEQPTPAGIDSFLTEWVHTVNPQASAIEGGRC